jgi:uncharacterized membrane protein
MEWVYLVLGRAVAMAGKESFLKLSVDQDKNHIVATAAVLSLIPAVLLLPWVFWSGSFTSLENPIFVQAILGNVAFNIAGQVSFIIAVKRFDISYVTALKATTPVLFGIFSFIFLGETLSPIAFAFISLVVAGCLLLEISKKTKLSFTGFLKESGWPLLLFHICMAAIATVFSKIAVTNGNPEAYIAFRYTLLSLSLFLLHWIVSHRIIASLYRKEESSWTLHFDWRLLLSGIFLTLSVITEMRALQLTEVSRVEALSKLSLILILAFDSTLISKTMNWKRWLATSLIAAGAIGTIFF